MPYKLQTIPAARKDLAKLQRQEQQRLVPVIDALANNPRPTGVVDMAGEGFKGFFRVRDGDFRVVYRVADNLAEVTIFVIGDRKDVYKKLRKRLGL